MQQQEKYSQNSSYWLCQEPSPVRDQLAFFLPEHTLAARLSPPCPSAPCSTGDPHLPASQPPAALPQGHVAASLCLVLQPLPPSDALLGVIQLVAQTIWDAVERFVSHEQPSHLTSPASPQCPQYAEGSGMRDRQLWGLRVTSAPAFMSASLPAPGRPVRHQLLPCLLPPVLPNMFPARSRTRWRGQGPKAVVAQGVTPG